MATKFTNKLVKEVVELGTGSAYTFISLEEKGTKDPTTGADIKRRLTLEHNKCGHRYTIPLYEFTDGKRRCPNCKGEVLRGHFAATLDEIRQKTADITNGEYSFVDIYYHNSKTGHLFQHNTCGTIFEKKWDKFRGTPKQAGQRCPECQRKGMESMASRYVRDILDYFKIEYECEKRFISCINPETNMQLPFDYYLPKINLLIEVDGEQHVRACFTPWDVEGTIKRDKIKNEYAEKKGIALVRIPAKEWSALPEFLFNILSEKLVENLTLQNVLNVKQSTHPERISLDLKKVHNGEYTLEDNFYTGSERKHRYRHLTCGCVFKTSLAYLKDNKHPCPDCREEKIKRDKHSRSNTLLIKKSNNKYSLSKTDMSVDAQGRRVIHCNTCDHEWPCLVTNLVQNKAGCPVCFELKKDKIWRGHYDAVVKALQNALKLDKKQNSWVCTNKRRHSKRKLKLDRVLLLQEASLGLL